MFDFYRQAPLIPVWNDRVIEFGIIELFKVSSQLMLSYVGKKVTHRCIFVVETNSSSFHLSLDFLGSTVYVIADVA